MAGLLFGAGRRAGPSIHKTGGGLETVRGFRKRLKHLEREPFFASDVELVNGYWCGNCADIELARRGMDPANPGREYSGGEVYVPPPAERSSGQLGVNEPERTGFVGRTINVYA